MPTGMKDDFMELLYTWMDGSGRLRRWTRCTICKKEGQKQHIEKHIEACRKEHLKQINSCGPNRGKDRPKSHAATVPKEPHVQPLSIQETNFSPTSPKQHALMNNQRMLRSINRDPNSPMSKNEKLVAEFDKTLIFQENHVFSNDNMPKEKKLRLLEERLVPPRRSDDDFEGRQLIKYDLDEPDESTANSGSKRSASGRRIYHRSA